MKHYNIAGYTDKGITRYKNKVGDEYIITARYFNKDMEIKFTDGTTQRISKRDHRFGNFSKETTNATN